MEEFKTTPPPWWTRTYKRVAFRIRQELRDAEADNGPAYEED